MESPIEYFNVNIEYLKEVSGGRSYISEGVHLVAFTKDEIEKYFQYIEQGKSDLHPIGNRKVNVVDPKFFKIFDFSKTKKELTIKRAEYEKLVKEKLEFTKDYLTAFEEIGDDVTDSFNIKLEDILQKREQNILSRLQNDGFFTTETIKTTLYETNQETNENQGEISSKALEQSDDLDEKKGDNKYVKPQSGSIKSEGSEPAVTIQPKQIFPNVFSDGIIDNSIEPAFDVKKIAKEFANHIRNLKDESGQMVGVFGQWGRGKSYFFEKVVEQFKSEPTPPFVHIKFQAWKYQNTTSVWAYLFETFIDEFLKVSWYEKIFRLIKLSIARYGHWKTWVWQTIGMILGLLAFSFTPALKDANFNQLIIKLLGLGGVLTISFDNISSILKKIKKPATTIFNSISKVPSFKNVLGVQAEIQKELKNLIKAWSKIIDQKRILLFVDDLDRCSDYQIVEIIDSLRVILDDELITKHVLILVALDEEKLKKAIYNKYEKLFGKDELPEVIDEYMDKLFISAIKLFPISFDDRAEFVKKLAKQINLEDNTEEEVKPKIEPLSTPTPTPEIDSNTVPRESPESSQGTAPIFTPSPKPTPTPEVQKSSKNLEEVEVTMLQEKIKLTNKELTPRQIRILMYRYLLARNLWLIYFDVIDWKAGDAIDEIMRFSGYSKEDPSAETKVFGGLSKIVRMVVAY